MKKQRRNAPQIQVCRVCELNNCQTAKERKMVCHPKPKEVKPYFMVKMPVEQINGNILVTVHTEEGPKDVTITKGYFNRMKSFNRETKQWIIPLPKELE